MLLRSTYAYRLAIPRRLTIRSSVPAHPRGEAEIVRAYQDLLGQHAPAILTGALSQLPNGYFKVPTSLWVLVRMFGARQKFGDLSVLTNPYPRLYRTGHDVRWFRTEVETRGHGDFNNRARSPMGKDVTSVWRDAVVAGLLKIDGLQRLVQEWQSQPRVEPATVHFLVDVPL